MGGGFRPRFFCFKIVGNLKIPKRLKVKGQVFSGLGRGSFFTGIQWVREGIEKLVGFEPKPGTLNLRLKSEDFEAVNRLREFGIPLPSADPNFCNAVLLEARIGGFKACAIFPEEDVWVHRDTLELVSPFILREKLGIKDGEYVEVEIIVRVSPDLIIFDADGTLIDSSQFYYKLAETLTRSFGFSRSKEKLRMAINLGLGPIENILIPEEFKDGDELIEELKLKGRELSCHTYYDSCKVIDGVGEVLKFLKSQKIRLGLLTTTYDIDPVAQVLRRGGIDPDFYFDCLKVVQEGCDKAEGIRKGLEGIIEELKVQKSKTAYVGDGIVNVVCAKEVGIISVSVLTGVGRIEEFEEISPDLILGSVREILFLETW